jgi:NitT/TauT family transport system permease protein
VPYQAKAAPVETNPPPKPNVSTLRFLMEAPAFLPVLALVLLVVAWEAIVSAFNIPAYLVPSPVAVWKAGVNNWAVIMENAWVTTVETLVGFFLSAVIGVAIAIGISAWPLASRAIYPLLVSSQVVPKVAIAPLVALWIGTGVRTSSLIAFVMAFFPVVVNATQGLNSADIDSVYLIRSMGGSRWTVFRYLRIPGALPFIWAGLQLAMAFAVVGAVVGEFVGASAGIGYLLIVAEGNLRSDILFAAIVVLTVIGLLLYYAVEWIARLTMKWN